MTRINLLCPSELSTKHLVAEYREITRVPGNLKKSLARKTKPFSFDEIPKEYVLGPGHVKFFYNKMRFLRNRFKSIINEMITRGYSPKFRDCDIFNCGDKFNGDYKPTNRALKLNKARIQERNSQKKKLLNS